ncbi:hypothetical protein EDC04DRAFT_2869272 [Pisolithus marmoratus]|nr:hypothetical protein EDC04DRAFT_2869272 [Pisolithus marmoratus]
MEAARCYHCLYPSATFTGTQKSGQSSYDDIDLSISFLCGYFCICCDQDDMVHWWQFPAFCHIRNKLKWPRLTMPDCDWDTLFMQWKERFLVPDHKVNDINGVDFADSSVQSTSLGSPNGPCFPLPAAMMSGFYYHEKSEP